MRAVPETSYRKATQALNFFARKEKGEMNKMKAIKLIYFADRLHLRKYGRPIVGDTYWAMKLGPVGSRVKRAAELDVPSAILPYVRRYIGPAADDSRSFASLRPTDADELSETDIECLNAVYATFGDLDQFALAEASHRYPEWRKHERSLGKGGRKRMPMDYRDFFARADRGDPLFRESASDLLLARELFEESESVARFFAA